MLTAGNVKHIKKAPQNFDFYTHAYTLSSRFFPSHTNRVSRLISADKRSEKKKDTRAEPEEKKHAQKEKVSIKVSDTRSHRSALKLKYHIATPEKVASRRQKHTRRKLDKFRSPIEPNIYATYVAERN